jgi:hypothetical protein
MNRTVITFFDEIKQVSKNVSVCLDAKRLLELWLFSWQKRGWQTVVLNREDAINNPTYNFLDLDSRDSRFYQCNPSNGKSMATSNNTFFYNQACYQRVLAYCNYVKEFGSTLYCDFDVINYSWTPDMMKKVSDNTRFNGERSTMFLSPSGVEIIEKGLIDFCKRGEPIKHTTCGKMSTSDMHVIGSIISKHKNLFPFLYHPKWNRILRKHPRHYISNIQYSLDDGHDYMQTPMVHYDGGCFAHPDAKKYNLKTRAEVVQFMRPI